MTIEQQPKIENKPEVNRLHIVGRSLFLWGIVILVSWIVFLIVREAIFFGALIAAAFFAFAFAFAATIQIVLVMPLIPVKKLEFVSKNPRLVGVVLVILGSLVVLFMITHWN